MKSIVIATKNLGKVEDFRQLFSKYHIEVKSLYDFSNIEDVEETGTTFEENAIKKAEEICQQLEIPVLADDSGLIVDELDGQPGVYSARFAGEEKDDKKNIDKLLQELQKVNAQKNTARFYCALAIAIPSEETICVHGTCEGTIVQIPVGNHGFGYDPVFYIENKQRTMAQLTKEEKNQISHRAKALEQLEVLIKEKW